MTIFIYLIEQQTMGARIGYDDAGYNGLCIVRKKGL